MSLLTASNLGKNYGAETVLVGVNARVARGEKIGIVGKNGGGKTTLLKILIGIEEPDTGSVSVARGVRIGYLSQIAQLDESRNVRQEAETALAALSDAETELREAEQAIAERPDDADALEAYGAARDRFDFMGGDAGRDHLFGALSAMGFSEADLEKPVGVLSGGEKTRLSMAKLLASSPDVLALDEPTNHLDIRAVEWLEGFLQRYPGAVLVVSHDRRLLASVTRTVWEVEEQRAGVGATLTAYTGGFEAYREQRAAARARQAEEYARQQAEIAKTEEFIRRNKAGQNSRNAMGRAKQLARLERLERPSDDPGQMKAGIRSSGRSGREVVVCERASKRYGDKVLLDNANFTIERGDRVGVVGPNGVGKTTLVEMILGEESPDAGYLRVGHGVTVAHHKQEADDFDPELTVLENFYERAGMDLGQARSHLAKFLFSGEDVFKPVSGLSGGERAKLAMALMVLSPANLLILDEPTNHLDVFSCDALTDALKRYDGTLVVVSHDRALLDAVTDRTLALEGGGKIALFDGPYRAYREAKDAEAARAAAPAPAAAKNGAKAAVAARPISASAGNGLSAHELSKERQRMAKRVAGIEAEVEKLEEKLARIEAHLAAPSGGDDVVTLSLEYGKVKDELAARMEEWEAATLEAESLGAPA
ncbi:MAG TPA: ABC-F family ATP-binding cassette domain-containing protein [Armatimonadaceae bacterium]|nr:ABC-F family ATP-binding cassette domain-containing protein [Armatimonadaceae bacterium]